MEERLPEDPLVVEPVHSIGKYGGTWRRLIIYPTDTGMLRYLGYEPLARWDRTARNVVPGLAKSWDIRDEGKTYAFRLRRGVRWSDGHPFTSEDILFWYEDMASNKDLHPVFPFVPDGNHFTVTAPDSYTVEFHFQRPNGIFLETMAFRGGWMYAPKHYLKQFHVRYADHKELKKKARKIGYDVWHRLFLKKSDLNHNPDLPTVRPWKISVPPPATQYIVERNPYYWKVDPEGNQLPYIDRIRNTVMQDVEMISLKIMNGESDMQASYMDTGKYTLYMENRERGNYQVTGDLRSTFGVYVNQYSKDPALRPLLQDRRFRIALSVALNREEIIELAFLGLAESARGVSCADDPYYLPEFDGQYLDYDPERANRLLDELGLQRGRDGMRRMPNGKPFRQLLYWSPEESLISELWELVVEYWREVGLHFILKPEARALFRLRGENGDTNFFAYALAETHWVLQPVLYVPFSSIFRPAPLYGTYIATGGEAGVEPPPEFRRLVGWYRELARTVGNEERKLELGRRILGQWAQECYFIGIVRDQQLWVRSKRFKNVPDHLVWVYVVMPPGYVGPEQFYIDEETQGP